MAWFAIRTKGGVSPSEVLRRTPTETRALRQAVEKVLKTDTEYDVQLAQLGGCPWRRR